MSTTQPNRTNVFGVYVTPNGYEVSRTGIILYAPGKGRIKLGPVVLSFVNGSMCINPLGQPVDASQFDEYAYVDLVTNHYSLKDVGRSKPKPRVAYWDPDSNTYVDYEPDWHKEIGGTPA